MAEPNVALFYDENISQIEEACNEARYDSCTVLLTHWVRHIKTQNPAQLSLNGVLITTTFQILNATPIFRMPKP